MRRAAIGAAALLGGAFVGVLVWPDAPQVVAGSSWGEGVAGERVAPGATRSSGLAFGGATARAERELGAASAAQAPGSRPGLAATRGVAPSGPSDPGAAAPAAPGSPLSGLEPSEGAVAELERASDRDDAPALLELVRHERSLVRHEALRRYLNLAGPSGLDDLVPLLAQVDDLFLIEVLGEAAEAGGSAEHAQWLSARLLSLPARARLPAARAVLQISTRAPLPDAVSRPVVEWLAAQARAGGVAGEDACLALALSPAGSATLDDLAHDQGLDPSVRQVADDLGS